MKFILRLFGQRDEPTKEPWVEQEGTDFHEEKKVEQGPPGFHEGKHYTEYHDQIKSLLHAAYIEYSKSNRNSPSHPTTEDRTSKAEGLLLRLVDAIEQESIVEGRSVSNWYYEQLAFVYRYRRDYQAEVTVLERCASQRLSPGAGTSELLMRLGEAKALAHYQREGRYPQEQPEYRVLQPTSIYDYRDRTAYGSEPVEPYCRENEYILKWWTREHDELLRMRIEAKRWPWWYGSFSDAIQTITPLKVIEAWKAEDPMCLQYAWYNVLLDFARTRAEHLGLTDAVREDEWKVCPLCGHDFVEDTLPDCFVERLGIDQLDFCAPCLMVTVLGSGNRILTKQDTLIYLRNLADVTQRVPPQGYGGGMDDFRGLTTQERLAVLQVLKRKPTVGRVKELFGSWLAALVEAGILEDGVRRTSRGTHCLAKDGHLCLSLGEKTIDDLLYSHGIAHEKEPHYPESNLRADFAVGGTFIEYFGLKGNPDYDAKTRQKKRLCKKHGISLISIYPVDLVSNRTLGSRLQGILPREG